MLLIIMQVILILLKWLQTLTKSMSDSTLIEMYLAYDNMCNVDRLKVVRAPLPLPPPMDTAWLNIKKIIDTFHLPNHVNPDCHRVYSPQTLKERFPVANTQAGEQTFIWLGRFRHIQCAMNKQHHLFYLHQMVYLHSEVLPRSKPE